MWVPPKKEESPATTLIFFSHKHGLSPPKKIKYFFEYYYFFLRRHNVYNHCSNGPMFFNLWSSCQCFLWRQKHVLPAGEWRGGSIGWTGGGRWPDWPSDRNRLLPRECGSPAVRTLMTAGQLCPGLWQQWSCGSCFFIKAPNKLVKTVESLYGLSGLICRRESLMTAKKSCRQIFQTIPKGFSTIFWTFRLERWRLWGLDLPLGLTLNIFRFYSREIWQC